MANIPGRAFLTERGKTALGRIDVLTRPRPKRAMTPAIVAMTSYPGRIGSVHIAIRSVQRQSVTARVVLVLSTAEFPDRRLPSSVIDTRVEVLWTDRDDRSYNKLLPVLTEYPESTIVTADDDIIYPRRWLEQLLDLASPEVGKISCMRGQTIVPGKPYSAWPRSTYNPFGDSTTLPTGVGGVLYPPGVLETDPATVARVIELAPRADDLGFKVLAMLRGTTVLTYPSKRPVDYPSALLRPVGGLMHTNVVGGSGNDEQWAALIREFGDQVAAGSQQRT